MEVQTEWIDFFNDHAPVYDGNCFTTNTLAEIDFLIDTLGLSPGDTILDIGCGTGRHALELAQRGYAVTGIDISPGMLEQAKRKAQSADVEVEWIHTDATAFSLDRQFDAAICLCEGAFGLLGTSDDPTRQPLAILRNVADHLKPAARCLFTVLNGFRMVRRHGPEKIEQGAFDLLTLAERSAISPPRDWPQSPMGERGFVPTELVLLFAVAGLAVESVWGGTAGNWGKRAVDPDEIELMVAARKAPDALAALLADRVDG